VFYQSVYRRGLRVLAVIGVMACQPVLASDIITATPVTYMLAQQLTKGTEVTTAYLPPKRYGFSRLPNWFETKGQASVMNAASEAKVAITLAAVWPQEPLYVHARQANISIIEIDASQAISPRATGVAALTLEDGSVSPYVWLNPANLTRMAMIVSDDLKRVWPQYAAQINTNRQQLVGKVRDLINQQQLSLQARDVDSVVLISSELEDFAAGHQLFVLERMTKSELEWSEQDKVMLRQLLAEDESIKVLTSRKISPMLAELVGDPARVLSVDNIDRWGGAGIDSEMPLKRWGIKSTKG